MSYIFKYNKDEQILRNGTYFSTFDEFVAENPEFPIVRGEWFEYTENQFTRMNEYGHHLPAGGLKDLELILAINRL